MFKTHRQRKPDFVALGLGHKEKYWDVYRRVIEKEQDIRASLLSLMLIKMYLFCCVLQYGPIHFIFG